MERSFIGHERARFAGLVGVRGGTDGARARAGAPTTVTRMGTRGFVGFVVDGVEKLTITAGDSYPGSGGVEILSWLTAHRADLTDTRPDGIPERARALRLVPASFEPDDPADLDRVRDALRDGPYADFADESVEEVLAFAAYDLGTLLRGGTAVDGTDFPLDSLFCEWGYLIDLDGRTFDVYRGFQTSPPTAGRFTGRPPAYAGHYPVALVASWSFDALPDRAGFLAATDGL